MKFCEKLKGKIDLFRIGCYIVLALILWYSLVTFYYTDMTDTLDNSVMLVEALKNGSLFDYYQYAAVNAHPNTVYTANYNILVYLLFALWNLPTALLHIFNGFDYMTSPFAIYWCKGLIIVALILCAYSVYRITERLADKEYAHLAVFFSLSSACVWLAAFCAVQYDCIMLALLLLAMDLLSQNKRKKAWLCFALAVPFKLFALFALIPAILVYEKKLYKAAVFVITAMVPSLLSGLPFRRDAYYSVAIGSQNDDAIKMLLKGASIGSINLFILFFCLICIVAYLYSAEDETERLHLMVWNAFVVYAAFLCLVPARSYWVILVVPFLSILTCAGRSFREILLLLELGAGFCGCLFFVLKHWIYSTQALCNRLLFLRGWRNTVPAGMELKYGTIQSWAKAVGVMQYRDLVKTLFWACLLGVGFLSFPYFRRKEKTKEEGALFVCSHMIARLLALSAIVGLFLFSSFQCQPTCCGGTIGDKDLAAGTVEIKETTGIISNVTFSDSRELESVEIPLKAENYNRADRSMLVFALCDDAGEMLWGTRVGMTQIKDGKLKLKIKGVKVENGRDYTFRIIKDNCPHGSIMKTSAYFDEQSNVFFWFR